MIQSAPGAPPSLPNRPGGIPGQPAGMTAPGAAPATPGGAPGAAPAPAGIGGIPRPTMGAPGVSTGGSTQAGPGAGVAPPAAKPATPQQPFIPPETMNPGPGGIRTSASSETLNPGPQASPGGPVNPQTGVGTPATNQPISPVTQSSNLVGSQINLTPNAATQQSGQQLGNLASNLSNPNVYQQAALGSFNTFAQQTDPAYQASMRQATAQAAANGGIGSGALSTSYGNLANQRNLQLEGMQQNAQQNALRDQAQYQLQQLGALQGVNAQQFGQQQAQTGQLDQQQQYQNALQQQGIGNAVTQTELQGQMQNQNFNQQLALANFGFGGNPDLMSSQLANQYGNLANQTGAGLGQIAQNQGINSALNGLAGGGNNAQALANYAAQMAGVPQASNAYIPQTSLGSVGSGLADIYGGGSGGIPAPMLGGPQIPQTDPSQYAWLDQGF